MPNVRTPAHTRHDRIPEPAEVVEMAQPSTSMRAVLARTVAGAALHRAELCELGWENVDLDRGVFSIVGSRRRMVPVLPLLGEALRTWKEVAPSNSSGLVFPNPRGEPFSPEQLGSWYRSGGGLYAEYPLMALRQFCLAWWGGRFTDNADGLLSAAQRSRLLGKAPTPSEWRQFAKFGSHDPIDLERLTEAETAVLAGDGLSTS